MPTSPKSNRQRQPTRRWEAWEIGYLKAFINVDPLPDIARNLNRSEGAVKQQAILRGYIAPAPRGRPPSARLPVIDAELTALRHEYARLRKSEQAAREQVAGLIAEINDAKRAQTPVEVTAIAPIPLPPREDRDLRKREKAQRVIIRQLCILLASERGAVTLDVAQAALNMTPAEYQRAVKMATTGGVNACLGKELA